MAVEDIPSVTTLKELLGAKQEADRWRAYFYEAKVRGEGRQDDNSRSVLSCAESFYTRQAGTSLFRVDEDTYDGGALFEDAIKLATTPARPPKALRFELGGGRADDLLEVLQTLGDPPCKVPDYREESVWITSEWKAYQENLKAYLIYLKELTEGHARAYTDLDITVKQSLETIDQKLLKQTIVLQYIQTQVGSSNTPQSDTLWNVVDSLREEVDYLLAQKGGLSPETIRQHVIVLVAQSEEMTSNMAKRLHQQQKDALDALQNKVSVTFKSMADEISVKKRETKASLGALEKRSVSSASTLTDTTSWTTPKQQRYQPKYPMGDGGASVLAFKAMERRVQKLEVQVEAMANLGPGMAQDSTQAEQPRDVDALLQDLDDKIERLKEKMDPKRQFKSRGFEFGSQVEVEEWLAENPMHSLVGVLDVFSLLSLMKRKAEDGRAYADRIGSFSDIGKEDGEADLMALYSLDRPPFFFVEKQKHAGSFAEDLIPLKEGFGGNMKSYKSFDTSSSSVKKSIQKWMKEFLNGMKALLEKGKSSDRLKLDLMTTAKDQADEILLFIGDYYTILVDGCNYEDKVAWTLAGRLVGLLCAWLREIRAKVGALEDTKSNKAKATFLWTCMEVHIEMEEIIRKGFQTHSILSAEIQEFQLVNRVDSSQLGDLEDQMNSLRHQLKEATSMVNKLENQVKAGADKVARATQDIGNMKTDINKIKAKG